MKRKFVIMATATVLGLAIQLDAQRMSKHDRIGSDTWAEELALSEEQKMKLEEINNEFRSQLKSISENENLEKEEKVEAIEKALVNRKADSEKVYDQEQQMKMESIRREQKAQALYNRGEKRKSNEEMREELQSYYEKEMLPHLKEWRQEFDKKLTPQDRSTINEMKAQRMANKEQNEEMKKQWKEDEKTREDRMILKGKRENRKSEKGDKIKSLMKKHEKDLISIRSENENLLKKWEEERLQIKEKYKTDNPAKQKTRRAQKQYNKEHIKMNRKGFLGVQFLLMEF